MNEKKAKLKYFANTFEIVEKGETDKVVQGRTYESGRRVEFELR